MVCGAGKNILLACGQSHGVQGFQWVNICGIRLLGSSILSNILRWSCISCSLVFALCFAPLRNSCGRWWGWHGGVNSNNNQRE